MNESLFHLYSMGYVAENKALDSMDILVTPHEVLPLLDGDLKSNPIKQSIQGIDAQGRNYSVSVVHDNCIKATWHNMAGDNRTTAPDVRRGEMVKIWRYGDADKFYWSTSGQANNLRKLETVTHAYSATADNTDDTLTEKNSYYHEVSSHKKAVTLSTSKVNGEIAGYKFQIDAANGFVHLQDDAGQVFELDTQNHRMSMTNADGSQVRVDGKNISIVCKDTLAISATNSVTLQTKDLVVKTETMEVNATTSVKFDTPNCEFTHAVKMETLEVTSTAQLDGLVTAQQGLNSPSVPIHGPSETLS